MKENTNKITLFVMSRKGLAVLQYMTEHYKELLGVVITSTDPNVTQDYYKEIKEHCKANNIICVNRQEQKIVDTQYAFAISWRWLIPKANFKLIVFHDSLLPRYRGFNPLVSMLINGENKVGVTALVASDKYDQGDIIAQSHTMITYPKKINDAIEIVIENYKDVVDQILAFIENDESINAKKQDDNDATYSLWRDEDDYRIKWDLDANFIKRFIDAMGSPYNGASTMIKNSLVRIFDAEIVTDVIIENRTPGKVIVIKDGCPVVVCGKGLLKITQLSDDHGKNLLPFKNIRVRLQ